MRKTRYWSTDVWLCSYTNIWFSISHPWPRAQMQILLTESISRLRKSRWLGRRLSKRHLFSNRISGASVRLPRRWLQESGLLLLASSRSDPIARGRKWRCIKTSEAATAARRQPPMVLPRVAGDDSSFKRVAPTSPFDLAALFAFSLCVRRPPYTTRRPLCLMCLLRLVASKDICLDSNHAS
jgi:hypothetical protein